MTRIITALVIAQSAVLFKQSFEGSFLSVSFMLLMIIFTSVFWYFLANRPLISANMFPEDESKLSPSNLHNWWNNYSHPLTVKSDLKANKSAALFCKLR